MRIFRNFGKCTKELKLFAIITNPGVELCTSAIIMCPKTAREAFDPGFSLSIIRKQHTTENTLRIFWVGSCISYQGIGLTVCVKQYHLVIISITLFILSLLVFSFGCLPLVFFSFCFLFFEICIFNTRTLSRLLLKRLFH